MKHCIATLISDESHPLPQIRIDPITLII